MTARDAREIYQLLGEARIRCWVVGGWGIDALIGRQTRPHKDLDVLLVRGEHARARERLHRNGFILDFTWEENTEVDSGPGVTPGHGGGPPVHTAYVLVDGDGRQIDVHVLDDDLTPLWTTDRAFVSGALEATGTIDGIQVRCLSAQMQRIAHSGYPLPDEQRRDLELLADSG